MYSTVQRSTESICTPFLISAYILNVTSKTWQKGTGLILISAWIHLWYLILIEDLIHYLAFNVHTLIHYAYVCSVLISHLSNLSPYLLLFAVYNIMSTVWTQALRSELTLSSSSLHSYSTYRICVTIAAIC